MRPNPPPATTLPASQPAMTPTTMMTSKLSLDRYIGRPSRQPRAAAVVLVNANAALLVAPRGERALRLEHHHAADRLAGLERGKTGIDLFERDAAGNQLVEIKPAIEIGARQHREVARRPRPAIARPADALLAHQRAPTEGDLGGDVGLTEPDHLTARPHRLDAEPEPDRATGGLQHRIDAAPGGFLLGDRGRVLAPRVDQR